ncbi:MAG: hypothetical protein POELPBGB_03331 [Bacteroidia bacterium]|nr:hypothetical protein [Bacteroidia bacterium]
MLKKVLLGIGGLLVLLLVVAYLLPSKVHVERSIVINAPASKIFAEVNSLQKWTAWDPWSKKDPNIQDIYTGPESGVGNTNTWKSDHKDVGSGSQTITESVPNETIKSKMLFGDAGEEYGEAAGFFNFTAEGENTKVVWGMDMDLGMNPMARYFGLMMDGSVGKDFEQGLTNLKAHVESLPDEAPAVVETAVGDSLKTETVN